MGSIFSAKMTIETDFPGVVLTDAAAIAENIEFFQNSYDIVVNRIIAARGKKVILGQKPSVCRFCSRRGPEVTFRKEAHAVPQLAANRTLISQYECDECNDRFSAFEDDLGKATLLERIAGQVLGKAGVPSAKAGQKRSRIDVDVTGFKIEERAGDPIAEFDHETNTLTITIAPQTYRPLGVFKALIKVALTLMDERDLAKVPEAVRWLRAPDLTTNQIDDGTRYTCFRSWTPGPAPFADTRVMVLRRRRADVPGPFLILVLAFGNLSFQIVVPAPREDRHLIGKSISLRQVPIYPLLDPERVRGPTRYWAQDLSSTASQKGSARVVFHYDSVTEVPMSGQSRPITGDAGASEPGGTPDGGGNGNVNGPTHTLRERSDVSEFFHRFLAHLYMQRRDDRYRQIREWITLVGLFLAAGIALVQLNEMRKVYEPVKRQADASTEAADTAKRSFEAGQRPWLSPHLFVDEDLKLNDGGGNVNMHYARESRIWLCTPRS